MGLVTAENITKVYSVKAEKVSKEYTAGEIAVRALNEVSFEIEPASFVSFVGPSGSGKTALLNLIGCLDKLTGGKLMVAGTDVLRLDRKQSAKFRGNNIGFIFQDFNRLHVFSVGLETILSGEMNSEGKPVFEVHTWENGRL
jgi:putative ABC transport system ATP-binding protein